MTIENEVNGNGSVRGEMALAACGLLGALAASSCCILPLLLFSLGVSGAWIGNFTRLAPYQPIFITAALVCLGSGAWLVRRTAQRACETGTCARPLPRRLTKTALIVAGLLVVTALAFDVLAPLLLNS